jgi:integrase
MNRAVARLLPPESASVDDLSREIGASTSTLERWRSQALSDVGREQVWTAAARFEAVLTTAANRDRFVRLPQPVLDVLRRFWREHRNPNLIIPNRQGGLAGSARATTPLDRGGVQQALKRVTQQCGLKKTSPLTACATAMPPT